MKRRLYIKTFGCQMNVHDSARIVELMEPAGYIPWDDPKTADVALINSCTVREKAWHKAISEAGRLRKHKSPSQRTVVGVVGCVAQQEGERIFKLVPGVDLVVAPDHYRRLPEIVEMVLARGEPLSLTGFDRGAPEDFLDAGVTGAGGEITAFVTIMKGCQERCAYCIVPSVRGPERFRPANDIANEVAELVASGVREVTLLGQKVNAYRRDGVDFVDLLERLDGMEGLWRLRFTSPHPRHMSPAVTGAFGRLGSLCESIHLPAQSGSDRTLSRMRRRYASAEYRDVIHRLREACPRIAISTDLIVGYPGETEEDFQATLQLIDDVRFSSAFSFKYSTRPGTPAARLEDDIPDQEKSRRLAEVHLRIEALEREWRASMVGETLEVLVEHTARMPGQVGGRARNNQIVNFTPPDASLEQLRGKLVQVEITHAHPHSLEGRMKA